MNWSIATYFLLSILLFYIQNWIGSKSYSKGYIKFSLLDEKDEAISLNFMVKVAGPSVFLIIVAALMQYLNLKCDLNQIIWIIYFYVFLRIFIIFLYERVAIVNWARLLSYYIITLLLGIIIQKKFISSLDILLPDFSELKNEIWLLIIIFLYQVGNNKVAVQESNVNHEQELTYLPELIPRKRRYVQKMYSKFKDLYGDFIQNLSGGDAEFEVVVYSILIFENFNRPPFIRFFERLWLRFSRQETSLGIMQVKTTKLISDITSIQLGVSFLKNKYEKLILNNDKDGLVFGNIIKHHSPDRKYIRQVLFISKAIIDHSFSKEDRSEKFNTLYSQISIEFGLVFDY